jgi:hypothetical protein
VSVPAPSSSPITFRVPLELRRELEKAAQLAERTISQEIRHALRERLVSTAPSLSATPAADS